MEVDVVGIDYPPMNFIALTERLPKTNELVQIQAHSWQGGGNVSSAMAALAKLGGKCGIIGVVGKDAFGLFCIEDFKRHGIDTSEIIVDPNGSTGFCICISEKSTEGRSFISDKGTRRELEIKDLNREYIASAKFMHIRRMQAAAIQAAKWAKEDGVKVVFDAGYFEKETNENIGLIDVFIASEYYYKGMFSDQNYRSNCRKIQEMGPSVVVFTFGEKGCVGLYGDTYFEIPIFKEVEVVDSTGAGDVFHGAFIYGMLQGWEPERIARFSSAVSAIKCTRLGGRAAIPDIQTVEGFISQGYIDYADIDKRVAFYKNGINSVSKDF